MRIKVILLAAVLLISATLISCSSNLSGTETAEAFLNHIRNKNFDAAYKMVSTTLKKEEFAAEYKALFDTLDIHTLEYEKLSAMDTQSYSTYNYLLTYKSNVCGDITDEFSMTIKLNEKNKRVILWSHSLLLPEMESGDKVYRSRITAERGDILTDNTVLAENVPMTAISIQTEDFTNEQIEANLKHICDTLELDYEEELSKVMYTVCVETLNKHKDDEAYEKVLEENIALLSEKLALDEDTLSKEISASVDEIFTVASYMPNDIEPDTVNELSAKDGISVKSSIYSGFALIEEYPPIRIEDTVINELNSHEGIQAQKSAYSTTRYYSKGSVLAHIVGYTGAMNKESADEEVERLNECRTEEDGLYTKYSITGRNGIEQVYETELRGKDGYRIYVRSADGINKRTIFEKPAEDGLDVQLTIDIELQEKTENLLENTLYGTEVAGAVIVMNPNTGFIEAIASYPTYDLNLYASGITKEENDAYMEMNSPFLNRALQGRYAPGSVYKAITAAAALDNNVLSLDYVFTGEIIDDTWKIPEKYGSTSSTDRIKRTHVKRRYSPLNMRNALLHSDNIYFANAALMLGDERMEAYWDKLGMNEKISFELPVALSQFKSASEEDRNVIQIAETGFGQGTMLVTPLQIAATFCAFANDGDIPTPHIVQSICREEGISYVEVETTEKSYWRENAIDSYVCKKITEMLKDVVSPDYNGTGQKLRVKSCTVAGKTGTAEVEKGVRDNSWFIGYRTDVPSEDARLVMVVLEVPVEEEYSDFKFEIARELLELDDAAADSDNDE